MMYTNLILYRNELKNRNTLRYKLIGIVVELLFAKEIFPKNSDIKTFLDEVMNIQFKIYIMKSRTMIVARVSKMLATQEIENQYNKALYKFINDKIEELKKEGEIKEKKNDFSGWLK